MGVKGVYSSQAEPGSPEKPDAKAKPRNDVSAGISAKYRSVEAAVERAVYAVGHYGRHQHDSVAKHGLDQKAAQHAVAEAKRVAEEAEGEIGVIPSDFFRDLEERAWGGPLAEPKRLRDERLKAEQRARLNPDNKNLLAASKNAARAEDGAWVKADIKYDAAGKVIPERKSQIDAGRVAAQQAIEAKSVIPGEIGGMLSTDQVVELLKRGVNQSLHPEMSAKSGDQLAKARDAVERYEGHRYDTDRLNEAKRAIAEIRYTGNLKLDADLQAQVADLRWRLEDNPVALAVKADNEMRELAEVALQKKDGESRLAYGNALDAATLAWQKVNEWRGGRRHNLNPEQERRVTEGVRGLNKYLRAWSSLSVYDDNGGRPSTERVIKALKGGGKSQPVSVPPQSAPDVSPSPAPGPHAADAPNVAQK
jgi:hypothetical protein